MNLTLSLICAVSEPLCLQQNGESESTLTRRKEILQSQTPYLKLVCAEHQNPEDLGLMSLKSRLQ